MNTEFYKMKRLSPSDPKSFTYKYRLIISLKPNIIVSKIMNIVRKKYNIDNIRVSGTWAIEIVLSTKPRFNKKILNSIKQMLLELIDYSEVVCFEAYVVIPSSINIGKEIRNLKIISYRKLKKYIGAIGIDDKKTIFWIYINKEKSKTIVKPIIQKIVNPIVIDPGSVSSTLFIYCSRDLDKIIYNINKQVSALRNILGNRCS